MKIIFGQQGATLQCLRDAIPPCGNPVFQDLAQPHNERVDCPSWGVFAPNCLDKATQFDVLPPSFTTSDNSTMECPNAKLLFENYAETAVKYFEAVDKLPDLVGQHERFHESKKNSELALERCRPARRALELLWNEHNCRALIAQQI
jgi:hypothetical protein